MFGTFGNTLDEIKLLYGCKVLWNKFVKGFEIFVFKVFFSIVHECVKSIVKK
jgi:hypothetical protein